MRIIDRTILLRVFAVLTLALLAACDSGSGSCVSGIEGDLERQTLNVYANNIVRVDGSGLQVNGWRRTDVNATKDMELYIIPASIISLCEIERYVYGEPPSDPNDPVIADEEDAESNDESIRSRANTKEVVHDTHFNAKISPYVTNIYLQAGQSVAVDLDGQYSVWKDVEKGEQPCPPLDFTNNPDLVFRSKYDNSCWINMGKGLVLSTGGANVEMYDYTMVNAQGVPIPGTRTIFTADVSGQLKIRHLSGSELGIAQDSAFRQNMVGNYKMDIYTRAECIRSKGKNLYAYIGETPPASVQQTVDYRIKYDDATIPEGAVEVGSNYMPYNNGDTPPKAWADGTLWLKVIDTPNDFDGLSQNNSGYYEVGVFADKPLPAQNNNFVRNVVNAVVDPIRNILNTASQMMFTAITNPANMPFVKIIQSLLVLYILFSCIGFMFGIVDVTQTELVVRVAKIAIVAALIGENSWSFFYTHFFSFFDTGLQYIINSLLTLQNSENHVHDSNFAFLTPTFNLLFASESWKKIAALLFSGPLGWIYILLIIIGIVLFLIGLIKFIILYLMALIGIALLISMAPVFIAFILFQQTKSLFDGWLKMLLSFTLQPILTLVALVLINYWIFASLTVMFSYSSCYGCVWRFTIDLAKNEVELCVMSFWLMEGFVTNSGGEGNDTNIEERMRASDTEVGRSNMSLAYSLPLIDKTKADSLENPRLRNMDIFFPILIFLIFAHAAVVMPSFMPSVVQSILSVTAGATTLSGAANDTAQSLGSYTKRIGGMTMKGGSMLFGGDGTEAKGLRTAGRRGINFLTTGDPRTLFNDPKHRPGNGRKPTGSLTRADDPDSGEYEPPL